MFFIEEKEKWWEKKGQIQEMISMRMLVLSYTIQLVLSSIFSKFQISRCSSSWETFDTNFPMHCIGVRDGKKIKWKKRRPNKFQHHVFLHTISSTLSRCIQSLKALAPMMKSGAKNVIGEKEKWINNGNDKQFLGAVVPDKSLTQISLCITLDWEMRKRKNRN